MRRPIRSPKHALATRSLRETAGSFSTLIVIASALFERDARAVEPVHLEVAAEAGYATNPGNHAAFGGGASPFGIDVGGRVGVELSNGIYAAASVRYFFARSATYSSTDRFGYQGTVTDSEQSYLLGAHAGYTFHVAFVGIRPQLGFGEVTISNDTVFDLGPEYPTRNTSASTPYPFIEPDLTVLAFVSYFVFGASAGLLVVPRVDQGSGNTKTFAALSTSVQIGVRF